MVYCYQHERHLIFLIIIKFFSDISASLQSYLNTCIWRAQCFVEQIFLFLTSYKYKKNGAACGKRTQLYWNALLWVNSAWSQILCFSYIFWFVMFFIHFLLEAGMCLLHKIQIIYNHFQKFVKNKKLFWNCYLHKS